MIEKFVLFLGNQELLILVIIFVVLLIWGPNQLPKLARALGQAKKEFEAAQKSSEEEPKKKEEE